MHLKYGKLDRILILTVLSDTAIDAEVFDVNLGRVISRHGFNTGWKYVLHLVNRTVREWQDIHSAVVIRVEN